MSQAKLVLRETVLAASIKEPLEMSVTLDLNRSEQRERKRNHADQEEVLFRG